MNVRYLVGLLFFASGLQGFAQQRCAAWPYRQQELAANPALESRQQALEGFIRSQLKDAAAPGPAARPAVVNTIRIPVVVHVVYHLPEQNIPTDAIERQLDALNRDYNRKNKDSSETPGAFKSIAADCGISFELARVDPQGRATTGIERIYSPVNLWTIEGDKVKFTAEYGADGWDAGSYLNIWVCNLDDLLGYASVMGDEEKKDGVVINFTVFNDLEDGGPFHSGRTAVHEIGHWLSLIHLWGDADCGNDQVADTPPQSSYTTGCPGGILLSCNNSPSGNMYMNFMDYTDDPCMNLFTNGQKDRMRSLFEPGGLRNTLLSSKALGRPWSGEIPLPEDAPRWLYPKIYPNPAQTTLLVDCRYDPRWIGQELRVSDISGHVLIRQLITSKTQTINISQLKPGIYFIRGNSKGLKIAEKFIRVP